MFPAAYTTAAKRLAQRHPTEKENATALRESVGRVEFEPPSFEACSFAYRRLFAKSPARVSTEKTGDDGRDRHKPTLAR
jgi:hypothetical protein